MLLCWGQKIVMHQMIHTLMCVQVEGCTKPDYTSVLNCRPMPLTRLLLLGMVIPSIRGFLILINANSNSPGDSPPLLTKSPILTKWHSILKEHVVIGCPTGGAGISLKHVHRKELPRQWRLCFWWSPIAILQPNWTNIKLKHHPDKYQETNICISYI